MPLADVWWARPILIRLTFGRRLRLRLFSRAVVCDPFVFGGRRPDPQNTSFYDVSRVLLVNKIYGSSRNYFIPYGLDSVINKTVFFLIKPLNNKLTTFYFAVFQKTTKYLFLLKL